MSYPELLHPEPLLLQQSTADLYLCRKHSNTVLAQSLWESLGPGAQKICLSPLECLWWVWGLILNAILPLLPSCWGFSFALGCGVSFFGGLQHSPIDGCSAASCNFGVLAGEDKCTSFYSAVLAQITEIDQKGVGIARGVVRRLKVILGIELLKVACIPVFHMSQ